MDTSMTEAHHESTTLETGWDVLQCSQSVHDQTPLERRLPVWKRAIRIG